MNVSNIFHLLNRFDKQEDRISAAFGFFLNNNKKVFNEFLEKLKIKFTSKDLKNLEIETQVSYDSGESRLDLQLKSYGKFLIFLESKIVKNENIIITQLNKYAEILNGLESEYGNQTRLVYINKFPIGESKLKEIFGKINLNSSKLYFFSWEDLLKMVLKNGNGDIYKQFSIYVGDTMYSKKVIKEQKVKDIVEVLVIHTNDENWKLTQAKKIAVQANGTPDARYIAFYRTHREDEHGNRLPQAITHIAEVISTQLNVPREDTIKGVPELEKWYKQKNFELKGTHKQYNLGELIKLEREIPFIRGGKPIGQVKFKTKMSELLRAKTISDLKRLRDLEN